ncbi:MAG: hypothetical protein KGL39_08775 [Patescibacteria group bacterium]|nr:hypothetical protein [Patescibacteria group bacterium]
MLKIVPEMRPCDVENIADFSRYYRYAWLGWHRHPKGPSPVCIQQVGTDVVVVQDVDGIASAIEWGDAQRYFSFGTPELGLVNGDYTTLYLYQGAPRQPHRGYRPNGVHQTVFNGWSTRKIIKAPAPSDKEIIRNLFFPVYYELKEAFDVLNSGDRVGCALSRTLGLYTNADSKYPSISYRRNTVGYLENDRKAVVYKMYTDAIPTIQKKLGVEVSFT